MAAIFEIQQSLNVLAGTTGLDAPYAANVWAGTTGLDLIGALNAKNGVTSPGPNWQDFNQVCCSLAGITGSGADAQNALSFLAGGGYAT